MIVERVQAGSVLQQAYGAARELARRGVTEGARVAVDTADSAAVLTWLLGADLLGAATLVVEPSWAPREREAVFEDARPDVVVTGGAEPTGERIAPAGDEGTLFYLPTTSGSSGRPKVLARTRGSWSRSFAALGRFPEPGPVFIPGPLSSSLFLFGALHAVWGGQEPRLSSRFTPEEACDGVTAVHLVPAMLAKLLAVLERRPDLRESCALRTVVCGGAHVGEELRARFSLLLPHAELVEYYGSAEHSLIAIRRGEDGLRVVPGVETDIRDGVLWVRSPLSFSGYLRGGVRDPAPEWSTVDDLARFTGAGALEVLGRAGTMVSSGGKLVPAEEVEAVLRGVPGVVDVLVTGTPHATLGAVVTAVVEGTPLLRELRAAARAGLEPGKRPRRWVITDALPRTASGKVRRS
ncbi:MAG TPA: AMP-binding protein [Amycolatopsis sp.]|nr:AMP-binding protein [Amycolatopsis sp.]